MKRPESQGKLRVISPKRLVVGFLVPTILTIPDPLEIFRVV